jgi:hypothetical protein
MAAYLLLVLVIRDSLYGSINVTRKLGATGDNDDAGRRPEPMAMTDDGRRLRA